MFIFIALAPVHLRIGEEDTMATGSGKMMNTGTLHQKAIALHRCGQLAEGARLYRELLASDTLDFTARHLLGVIHAQQGTKPRRAGGHGCRAAGDQAR